MTLTLYDFLPSGNGYRVRLLLRELGVCVSRFPEVVPTQPYEFEAWWRDGKRALGVLDSHLANRDFVVGDDITIADLGLFSYVHCADEGGFDLTLYQNITHWLARIKARPAWIAMAEVPAAEH